MHLSLENNHSSKTYGKQPALSYQDDVGYSGASLGEGVVRDQSAQETDLSVRVGMMFVIFSVSLLAASFPTISKRVKSLRIPRVLFFIGKHFGTGVILSTAFVHLLQDAFERLTDPQVRKQTNLGHWTGLIVLGSLLTIFLVEYVSTSYVDRLQSYPSAPPSPKLEPSQSPLPSPSPSIPDLPSTSSATSNTSTTLTEQTPLLSTITTNTNTNTTPRPNPSSRRFSAPSVQEGIHNHTHLHPHTQSLSNNTTSTPHTHTHTHGLGILEGHHRHESRGIHGCHHERSRRKGSVAEVFEEGEGDEHEGEREQEQEEGDGSGPVVPNGHHRTQKQKHNGHAGHNHGDLEALMEDGEGDEDGCSDEDEGEYRNQEGEVCDHDDGDVEIGRKRQVVGILVLQMGIMIHSLVIGLTLAIASGADFTSLVTAIVFHNLFEGLSLGIRIAGLPAPSQLPSETTSEKSRRRFGWLKPTLAVLFAVTTPVGIVVGLVAFDAGGAARDSVRLKLIEGLMSAISAGMLIYAACVEMLAGDFVLDPTLWRSGVRRQVLALGSLMAGVAGMAVLGIMH